MEAVAMAEMEEAVKPRQLSSQQPVGWVETEAQVPSAVTVLM